MARTKKTVDKEELRQRRAVLYAAIEAGAVTLQHAVKEMRAISRLTQAQFAEHRGVSLKTIKEIESGKESDHPDAEPYRAVLWTGGGVCTHRNAARKKNRPGECQGDIASIG